MKKDRQPEGEVFGARLRELRESRGVTQSALSTLSGLSGPYISEMERGFKVPSLTTILRLAVALDCEAAEFVTVFSRERMRELLGS